MERLTATHAVDTPGVSALAIEDSPRLWRVYHDHYAFCLCERSTSEWLYRGRTEPHAPGDVRLIEPGEVHRAVRMDAPSDFRLLFIAPELMQEVAEETWGRTIVHFASSHADDARLRSTLRHVHSLLASDDVLARDVAVSDALSYVISRYHGRARRRPSAPTLAIRRARDMLTDSYDSKLPLQELADEVGLNKHHLVAAFKQHVGMTPHEYQIAVRIAQARRLLREGLPGSEVALRVGFADQAHLIRHFKRALGVTPRAFSRRERAA